MALPNLAQLRLTEKIGMGLGGPEPSTKEADEPEEPGLYPIHYMFRPHGPPSFGLINGGSHFDEVAEGLGEMQHKYWARGAIIVSEDLYEMNDVAYAVPEASPAHDYLRPRFQEILKKLHAVYTRPVPRGRSRIEDSPMGAMGFQRRKERTRERTPPVTEEEFDWKPSGSDFSREMGPLGLQLVGQGGGSDYLKADMDRSQPPTFMKRLMSQLCHGLLQRDIPKSIGVRITLPVGWGMGWISQKTWNEALMARMFAEVWMTCRASGKYGPDLLAAYCSEDGMIMIMKDFDMDLRSACSLQRMSSPYWTTAMGRRLYDQIESASNDCLLMIDLKPSNVVVSLLPAFYDEDAPGAAFDLRLIDFDNAFATVVLVDQDEYPGRADTRTILLLNVLIFLSFVDCFPLKFTDPERSRYFEWNLLWPLRREVKRYFEGQNPASLPTPASSQLFARIMPITPNTSGNDYSIFHERFWDNTTQEPVYSDLDEVARRAVHTMKNYAARNERRRTVCWNYDANAPFLPQIVARQMDLLDSPGWEHFAI